MRRLCLNRCPTSNLLQQLQTENTAAKENTKKKKKTKIAAFKSLWRITVLPLSWNTSDLLTFPDDHKCPRSVKENSSCVVPPHLAPELTCADYSVDWSCNPHKEARVDVAEMCLASQAVNLSCQPEAPHTHTHKHGTYTHTHTILIHI